MLDGSGNVLETTLTDENGEYLFTGLRPGTYGVREIQPEAYFHGGQVLGSGSGTIAGDDFLTAIEIGSGEDLVQYNFCEVPPAALSGYVFQDGDVIDTLDGQLPDNLESIRNGLRTSDDTPLAGVVLELRNGRTGLPIQGGALLPGVYGAGPVRTKTDANGYYEFTGLRAGDYAVYEIQPADLSDGVDTPGTTGGVAVNRSRPLDPEISLSLQSDPGDDAILRIPLAAGELSVENNFSEVVVRGPDPKIPFVPEVPELPPIPSQNPVLGLPTHLVYIPPQPVLVQPRFLPGGSSKALGFTWHLSVVDAGFPRTLDTSEVLVQLTGTRFDVVAWRGQDMAQSSWTLNRGDESDNERNVFGSPDAIPIAGDFNGDGIAEIGVFIDGEWFVDVNGNGRWDNGDLWAKLGHEADQPVVGDWDGDGKTDIGIFGPAWPRDPHAIAREPGLPDPYNQRNDERWKNVDVDPRKNVPPEVEDATAGARAMKLSAQGKVRSDLIDHVFHYGTAGDRALVGDWNGDAIAVFRHGAWHLDVDGDGQFTSADRAFQFGQSGDLPVVGDWDGNGVDEVGVYRAGTWRLDSNGNQEMDAHDRVFEMGTADDLPVTADFDGDGTDDPALYHPHRRAG